MPASQRGAWRTEGCNMNSQGDSDETTLFIPETRAASRSQTSLLSRHNSTNSDRYVGLSSNTSRSYGRSLRGSESNSSQHFVTPDQTHLLEEEEQEEGEEEEEGDDDDDEEMNTACLQHERISKDVHGLHDASVDVKHPVVLDASASNPETLLQPLVSMIADAVARSIRAGNSLSTPEQSVPNKQSIEISLIDSVDQLPETAELVDPILTQLMSHSDRLLRENEDLNTRCRRSEDEIKLLRLELADLKSAFDAKQNLEQINTRNAAGSQVVGTTSLKGHIAGNHDIDRYIDHYEEFTTKMEVKTKSLEEMFNSLRSGLLEKNTSHAADMSSLRQKFDAEHIEVTGRITKHFEAHTKAETQLTEQTRALRHNNDAIIKQVQTVSALVDKLQGRSEQLAKASLSKAMPVDSELLTRATQATTRLDQFTTDFADIKTRTGRMEHTIAALTNRYNHLTTKEMARKMLSIVQPLPIKIQQQQEKHEDHIGNLQVQVDRVEAFVTVANKAIQNNTVSMNGLINTREAFEAGIDKKHEDLQEGVKQARDKIHEDIIDLQKDHTKFQSRLAHVERKVLKPTIPIPQSASSKTGASQPSTSNDATPVPPSQSARSSKSASSRSSTSNETTPVPHKSNKSTKLATSQSNTGSHATPASHVKASKSSKPVASQASTNEDSTPVPRFGSAKTSKNSLPRSNTSNETTPVPHTSSKPPKLIASRFSIGDGAAAVPQDKSSRPALSNSSKENEVTPVSQSKSSKIHAPQSRNGDEDDCIVVRTTHKALESDWRDEDEDSDAIARSLLARFTRPTAKTNENRPSAEKQVTSAKRKRRVVGENYEEQDLDYDESETSGSPIPPKRRR